MNDPALTRAMELADAVQEAATSRLPLSPLEACELRSLVAQIVNRCVNYDNLLRALYPRPADAEEGEPTPFEVKPFDPA